MSQAHYVRCDHVGEHIGEELPPAAASVRSPLGTDFRLCRSCLDEVLDYCDDRPGLEPLALDWVYDAGTRHCPLHHWPDVLCSDWGPEHAAMLRALNHAPTEGASP